MSQKIRLMIIDEYRLYRECLASFLAKQEGLIVTELIADPEEALEKARKLQPDIMLVNINFPDNKTFELTKRISVELSHIKVI
ncbi:MAG TPA: response regulator, partial [Thermodesulfobacteriota bacterium]|nr:response regulator [Thermodesulfobacteriota bacterium]